MSVKKMKKKTKKSQLKKNKRKSTLKKTPAKRKKPVSKIKKPAVVGIITHYFPKVRAAVIKLKIPLKINDRIKIKGHTTDFCQNVTSMQVDKQILTQARKGQIIGLLVDSRVRHHDIIYKES